MVSAKVIAGLTAMLALCVPYALSIAWQATPGHRPVPFNWHFVLGAIADLATGIVFYGAGLYIGAQPRWFRAAGFVAAAAIGIFLATAQTFSGFMLIALAASALLIAAAGSVFTSHGDYEAQPVWSRATQAAVVGTMVFAGTMIVGGLSSWLLPSAPSEPPRRAPEGLVTADGTIALLTMSPERTTPLGLHRVARAVDLNGNRLPALEDTSFLTRMRTGVIMNANAIPTDTVNFIYDSALERFTETKPWATRIFSQLTEPAMYYEKSTGLISLYSEKTRRLTGWLGPDGFSAFPKMPASRFPGVMRSDIQDQRPELAEGLLILSGGVYRLHGLRKPELIFRPPPGEVVVAAATGALWGGPQPKTTTWAFFTLVTTNAKSYILGVDHQLQFAVPHATHGANRQIRVMRAYTAPGMPTYVWNSPYQPGTRDSMTYVSVYPQGASEPVAHHTFMASSGDVNSWSGVVSGGDDAFGSDVTVTREITVSEPASLPISIVPGADMVGSWSVDRDVANEYGVPARKWNLLRLFAFTLALSLVVLWMGRRYQYTVKQIVTWMVLTVITGPVALLTMWLLVERPARDTCPKCKRPRVVTRDLCIHCGAEFDPPQRDGTELLLPLSSRA
jgi:hypothetical protein